MLRKIKPEKPAKPEKPYPQFPLTPTQMANGARKSKAKCATLERGPIHKARSTNT